MRLWRASETPRKRRTASSAPFVFSDSGDPVTKSGKQVLDSVVKKVSFSARDRENIHRKKEQVPWRTAPPYSGVELEPRRGRNKQHPGEHAGRVQDAPIPVGTYRPVREWRSSEVSLEKELGSNSVSSYFLSSLSLGGGEERTKEERHRSRDTVACPWSFSFLVLFRFFDTRKESTEGRARAAP